MNLQTVTQVNVTLEQVHATLSSIEESENKSITWDMLCYYLLQFEVTSYNR